MGNMSGNKHVPSPENRNGSRNPVSEPITTGAIVEMGGASFSIDDAIQMHLVDCDQCREATSARPVAIGQKSKHCDTYWHLQMQRANFEGRVNNVVNYTEFGDEAPKSHPLD